MVWDLKDGGTLSEDTVCMAISDDFGFLLGVVHVHVPCVHEFFEVAPLGNSFFRGNFDCFFRSGNSPAPFSGEVSTVKTIFFLAVLRSAFCGAPCDLK